jgi:hypothetical protein
MAVEASPDAYLDSLLLEDVDELATYGAVNFGTAISAHRLAGGVGKWAQVDHTDELALFLEGCQ